MLWMRGKEDEVVVAWMWRVEEPLAERRQDLVAAREKMSATWAGGQAVSEIPPRRESLFGEHRAER